MSRTSRHALKRSPLTDKVVAGQLYAAREIARRTDLTQDQATEAMQAFYEIAWEVLLSGYRLRLGDVGEIGLCQRRGAPGRMATPLHGTVSEWDGSRPVLDLRGRLSTPAKDAWYDKDLDDYDPDDYEPIPSEYLE